MKTRPVAVWIVGSLFIATGALGLGYHLTDFKLSKPVESELIWISLVRLLAIVSGVFILLGRNWARWLALAWIAFHVVISFPSIRQVLVHGFLFMLVTYCLYRPEVRAYFNHEEAAPDS